MKILLLLLTWISAYLPLLLALITWRKRFHYMWLYLVFGGLAEVASAVMKNTFNKPMDGVGNIYFLGEVLAYSLFFSNAFSDKVNRKWGVLFVVGWVAVVFCVICEFFWTRMNMTLIGINCFVLILFSLAVFRRILLKQEFNKLNDNPTFWFNTGIFIYASGGCLFFLLLEKVLEEDTQFLITLWMTFYCIINLIRYTFIGIGLNRLAYNERI